MSEQLEGMVIPKHVAMILDGNGRWAKKRGLPRSMGHREGCVTVEKTVEIAARLGIEYLTVYGFSTENWKRSAEEVGALMSLLLEYFTSEIDELDEKNVCIRILGDKDGLPAPQRDALIAAETRTVRNTGLKLNIAINYGGRAEIVRAARMLAQKAVSGEITPEDIDENAFAAALYTHDLPDVDLLIRTSGEMRLSNFLLYQCAYAEMEFPTVLWPDFSLADYHAALEAFAARDRRFGGRKQ